MGRRQLFLCCVLTFVACGSPPAERKPLAQEAIGTATAPEPASASTTTTSSSSSAPSTSSTVDPGAQGPPPVDAPDSAPASASKVGDLFPPKGKKPDFSRLAARSACREKRPPRQALLGDLRGMEQLLSATTAGSSDRESALVKIAQGYAQLECSLASACGSAKDREAAVLAEDVSIAEARKKTEQHCATLKSEFPKGKRQCP